MEKSSVFTELKCAYTDPFGYIQIDSKITEVFLCQDKSGCWLEVYRGSKLKKVKPIEFKLVREDDEVIVASDTGNTDPWDLLHSDKAKWEKRPRSVHLKWKFNKKDSLSINKNRLLFGHDPYNLYLWGIWQRPNSLPQEEFLEHEIHNPILSSKIEPMITKKGYGDAFIDFDLCHATINANKNGVPEEAVHILNVFPTAEGIAVQDV